MKQRLYITALLPGIFIFLTAIFCQAREITISTFQGHPIATETISTIMKEAYDRIGIKLKVVQYPGERSIQAANKGMVDGELFRKKHGIEEIFVNLIKVPVCIHVGDFVVFTKRHDFSPDSWESLLPYVVGYKRGVKVIEMNLPPETQTHPLDTILQAFKMLELDRADVVIDVRADGMATLKKSGVKNVKVLTPPILQVESFHYLHKKNKDLIAPLTTALEQMKAEGFIKRTQQEIEQRYISFLNK